MEKIMKINARVVETSEYETQRSRVADAIGGTISRQVLKRRIRIRITIGNRSFTSDQSYKSFVTAQKAADDLMNKE